MVESSFGGSFSDIRGKKLRKSIADEPVPSFWDFFS
jgi:hypothetical protein